MDIDIDIDTAIAIYIYIYINMFRALVFFGAGFAGFEVSCWSLGFVRSCGFKRLLGLRFFSGCFGLLLGFGVFLAFLGLLMLDPWCSELTIAGLGLAFEGFGSLGHKDLQE